MEDLQNTQNAEQVTDSNNSVTYIQPDVSNSGQQAQMQQPQIIIQNNVSQTEQYKPVKNKLVAGLLALFLGGIGIHKFYLGQVGTGIVYLLFSWTFIPAFIALIEAIIILTSSDEKFGWKYNVRVE